MICKYLISRSFILRANWRNVYIVTAFCLKVIFGVIVVCAGSEPALARGKIVNLRTDCGARGDGVTDDGNALKECEKILNDTLVKSSSLLFVPAGEYRIGSVGGGLPVFTVGAGVLGAGPYLSIFKLDVDFSGNLFAWSDTWVADHFSNGRNGAVPDKSGAFVQGISVIGDNRSKLNAAAFVFFGRVDSIVFRDVAVGFMNGPCISIGNILDVPQSYMRESSFYDVKCFNSGSIRNAAVEIGSITTDGSDATNELDFYKLAIFAAKNVGLSIRNPNPYSATRKIRFFGLRVEDSGGDDVQIAPAPDKGQVAEIGFYDLSALTAGGAALRIGGAGGKQPYAIAVHGGLFGPGNKTGIEIDNGRLIDIELSALDAPVVLGPGAGADITIHGNGGEYDWTYQGTRKPGEEAVPLNLRAPYGLYGLPNAGGRIGAAALKGEAKGGAPVRLTMDGKPADAYNCFNPSYAQAFNLDIQLMAVDRAAPDRFYAWRMPLSVLSAWTGAGAAKFTPGEATSRGVAGAAVEAGPDTRDGCLALTFAPPKGDADPWDVTAAIHFARVP